jgi:transcriptional regulator with XRE-family HTH domain
MSNIDPRAILQKRLDAGISMRTLATELGVSAAYISDILAGHREPGPAVLDPLGLECDVTVTKTYRRKKPAKTN